MHRRLDRIFEEIAQGIEKVDSLATAHDLLERATRLYNLRNIAYLGTSIPGVTDHHPYLAVTYSKDWVEHYKRENYLDCDPVILDGFKRLLPLEWNEFEVSKPRLKKFFGEAAEFGVGRYGVTVPIRGQHGERALFTITSDVPAAEWAAMRRIYMRDFQVLAAHIHEMILRLEGVKPKAVALSRREREVLLWISEGKTAPEIATILGLSTKTVRFYLENARGKLDVVNNTQAVVKAINLNLLSATKNPVK
ncbi:LuxR family transcriptional regulator [Neorhizobium sp. DT-125]|uniref:LuxR family transcriptional regulator n=1 Tax=Neorhizobium sp. DT-125 TaxID=3396163 RepID=UPI003F1C988B